MENYHLTKEQKFNERLEARSDKEALINQTICKLLIDNSLTHIIENNMWVYFIKSDYYQYLKEDLIKYKDDQHEINLSVRDYAEKFCTATRHLNLI